MGRPQALNLSKARHRLAVYARRAQSMQPPKDAGAISCASPAEVAAQSDIAFIMVSDTPDEQVVLGPNGVIHAAKPGAIVADMSTISPTAAKPIAIELAAKVEMLDAPVSGGELTTMVGGKQEVFDRVAPLFECMGKAIALVGDNGAGQSAEACNQVVVAVTIEAVSEALALARRYGVDPAKVREALMGGFADGKIMEVHGKRMLDGEFKPGFLKSGCTRRT